MRKKGTIYLLIVLLIAMLCPFSLAEGLDYIVPPPLTEWPGDPGPKPERPIYPAIQTWVTAPDPRFYARPRNKPSRGDFTRVGLPTAAFAATGWEIGVGSALALLLGKEYGCLG